MTCTGLSSAPTLSFIDSNFNMKCKSWLCIDAMLWLIEFIDVVNLDESPIDLEPFDVLDPLLDVVDVPGDRDLALLLVTVLDPSVDPLAIDASPRLV